MWHHSDWFRPRRPTIVGTVAFDFITPTGQRCDWRVVMVRPLAVFFIGEKGKMEINRGAIRL